MAVVGVVIVVMVVMIVVLMVVVIVVGMMCDVPARQCMIAKPNPMDTLHNP